MEISFDADKRARNLAKHGLDLADARSVLAGRCLHRLDDRFDYGEDRWITLGLLGADVVVCIWAEWPEAVRVISLRKANAHEREIFFGSGAG